MKPKQIAKDGICEFDCNYCKLEQACNEYNHRGNDDIKADQAEVRQQFALEYLERMDRINKVNTFNGQIIV